MNNKLLKIALATTIIVLTTIITAFAYMYKTIDSMASTIIDINELKISDHSLNDDNIVNIALFGVDNLENSYKHTRTDMIMIITLNKSTNDLTVTSFERDLLVDIEEYGYDKLNHAYAYGGPSLALQTLNKNFDLNVSRYITMNFFSVEKLINSLGGVKATVTTDEALETNVYINEINQIMYTTKPVKHIVSGDVKLNGRQAVAYMRIRNTIGSNNDRMSRQRTILLEAFNTAKKSNIFKLFNITNSIIPEIETNLTAKEIFGLAPPPSTGITWNHSNITITRSNRSISNI